jgi:transposase InsO family protein
MRSIHGERHKRSYGSPRMWRELRARGLRVCQNTVARLMREHGIRAATSRKFRHTTDSNHAQPVADNVLQRDFRASRPNEKWVMDITYLWTEEGWLYLAAVEDLYSRKVVGWSLGERLRSELVTDALRMAIGRQWPGEALLAHSDRGSQYASARYQALLASHGITCSMSRRGNCWDNAPMESFFATLKKELVYQRRYATRAEARRSVFEYIEVFYNRERRHSALGYVSPCAFEEAAA